MSSRSVLRGRLDERLTRSRWWLAAAAILVLALAVSTRFVGLDTAPAEWYGDISTVYEYVLALRDRNVPDGFFLLGVGITYPAMLRPALAVFGTSYLTIKATGAAVSIVGLVLVVVAGRQLRSTAFGLYAAAVASVSAWWMAYSRLGDVQALTPTLAIALTCTLIGAVRRNTSLVLPAVAALISAAGVYTYGNTVVLPVIAGLTLLIGWRAGRVRLRGLATFLVVLLASLGPLVVAFMRTPEAFTAGHASGEIVTGWAMPVNFARTLWPTLGGYLWQGDPGFRGHPASAAHLDRLSVVLAVLGITAWLSGPRRVLGIFLVGSFMLLHVPAMLSPVDRVPSISRTVAAAPLAALFIASGVAWVIDVLTRWRSSWRSVGLTFGAVTLVVIGTVNVHAYIYRYLPGLPNRNVSISRSIVDYTDRLPADVGVYLVGSGWVFDVPAFKSIVYTADHPDRYSEIAADEIDCDRLPQIPRPAVMVWTPTDDLPSPGVGACLVELGERQLVQTSGGTALFHLARLG